MSDSGPAQSPIELKSPAEIEIMRKAGKLLAKVLKQVSRMVHVGITTRELDRLARELIEGGGARPAFLGYENYPNTLCTSVNEQVVHGIPSRRMLKEGEIVSLDCGLFHEGFFVDAALTVPVGKISDDAQRLLTTTRESLEKAIDLCRPGNRLGDIGQAIQQHVEAQGFNVVRDYTGHGIGRRLHEPPKVLNYGRQGAGIRLLPGMVLAIEPMVNQGTWKTEVLNDDWTVVSADGSLSSHFEHTIAVTESGPQVLTVESE